MLRSGGAARVRTNVPRVRSIQRPWACDDYLQSVVNNFVEGEGKLVRIIQYSPVIKGWYTTALQRMDLRLRVTDKIADLGWAKQRYDGIKTPLGRAVLSVDALIIVANLLVSQRGRTSREGLAGAEFLDFLSNESYVTLAMLADGADEGSKLCHAFDSDCIDEATVQLEYERYQQVLRTLFIHGQCLHAPGYTRYALEAVKSIRLCFGTATARASASPRARACPYGSSCQGSTCGRASSNSDRAQGALGRDVSEQCGCTIRSIPLAGKSTATPSTVA